MELKKMKLDFTDLTQAELRAYQEIFVSTISKLKHGLFNAEAALGLQSSLMLLGEFHHQTSNKLKDIAAQLEDIAINTDVTLGNEDETN